jgi:kinesin family protein 4/21/27
LSISLPNSAASPVHPNERSVHSLEKEIMRLQEVLKEREAEIAVLEGAVKESQAAPVSSAPGPTLNGVVGGKHTVSFPPPKDPITPPTTASVDEHPNPVHLSPKTISQFDNIRRSMSHEPPTQSVTTDSESELNGGSAFSDQDESLERLNELMLWVFYYYLQLREKANNILQVNGAEGEQPPRDCRGSSRPAGSGPSATR